MFLEGFLTSSTASVVFLYLFMFFFFSVLIFSLIKNRKRYYFYSIIVDENDRLSKTGICFCVLIFILVYLVLSGKEIPSAITEIFLVTFGAEFGNKYISSRATLTPSKLEKIKKSIETDKNMKTASAKVDDDLDF